MQGIPARLTESFDLVALSAAFRQLESATTINEVKDIRHMAEVARTLAKKTHVGIELQNKAAELKVRAERKAGQLLAGLNLAGGDRKSNGHRDRLKLNDVGISQNQSKRWQKQASLPDEDFERFIHHAHGKGLEISSAALLRLVQACNGKTNGNGRHRTSCVGKIGDDLMLSLRHSELKEVRQLLSDLVGHRNALANLANKESQDAVTKRLQTRYLSEMKSVTERLEEIFS